MCVTLESYLKTAIRSSDEMPYQREGSCPFRERARATSEEEKNGYIRDDRKTELGCTWQAKTLSQWSTTRVLIVTHYSGGSSSSLLSSFFCLFGCGDGRRAGGRATDLVAGIVHQPLRRMKGTQVHTNGNTGICFTSISSATLLTSLFLRCCDAAHQCTHQVFSCYLEGFGGFNCLVFCFAKMAPPLCCRQTRLLASGAISATEIPYSPGPKVMGSVASLVWLKKKRKCYAMLR